MAHLRERREDTAVAVDRSAAAKYLIIFLIKCFCEAQARVRQGSARDGPQGERH